MPADNTLTKGLSIESPIELGPVTIPRFLDVGLTRNFASSQAFEDKKARFGFGNDIIPAKADEGLQFAAHKADVGNWLCKIF